MKQNFCDYETAKMLKELGMNFELICYYFQENVSTHMCPPLWQQIEEFLDNRQQVISVIFTNGQFTYSINGEEQPECYNKRHEARTIAIKHAIRNLQNSKSDKQ